MKEANDKRMSLTGHLSDLRVCLIISVVAIAAGFVISFYFSEQLLRFLTRLIFVENRPHVVFKIGWYMVLVNVTFCAETDD